MTKLNGNSIRFMKILNEKLIEIVPLNFYETQSNPI